MNLPQGFSTQAFIAMNSLTTEKARNPLMSGDLGIINNCIIAVSITALHQYKIYSQSVV